MQKLILYIQPQLTFTVTAQDYVQLDLMESDLITLTQVIQDVRSIDKVFTDYSRTFNLPASKNNNKIFKWWYNPDLEGFDNQVMANARIELNHFAFKEGKIRLESVTMRNNQPSMYKVTFFGNTVKLNDLIGEDKLQNLAWLNNFNHELTNANVKDGLEFGLNFTIDSVSYPDAIIYPLIAHSQQYIYDDTNSDDSGLNISYTNTAHQGKRGVFPEDLKPAILIKHIIKAIEEQYSLTFKTSEFFDSTHMDNLYMWLHRDKGIIRTENNKTVDDQAFTCTSSTANCNHFSDSSYNAYFDTTKGTYSFYDTQSDGLASPERFDFGVEIVPTSATTVYTLEIINTLDGTVYATKQNVQGTQTLNTSFGPGGPIGGNIPINLNEQFVLAARVTSNFSLSFACNINIDHYEVIFPNPVYQQFTADYTSNSTSIALIGDITTTLQIPDIKVLDFLNGMFKMFNLTSYVDFNGEIVVKRLDDYYDEGDTLDITEYVKTGEHTVNNTIPFSEVDLEYSEPKSILAQTFLTNNNRKYGEVEYKTNASDKKIYKVTAPFEHMLFSRLSDLTDNTLTDLQTGCFLDEELNPSIGQPLLFYGVYRTSITNTINFCYNVRPETYGALAHNSASGSDIFELDSYWMPHHANELGSVTTAPSINLNFGSEIDTYNLTDYSGQNNSLFLKNYQNYITRVFDKKTRLYKFSAVLPLKILLELTLDDKVIIGTKIYTINSMSTKLQSGETELELLNQAPE